MDHSSYLINLIKALEQATSTLPEPMTADIVQDYGKDPYLVLISCLLSLRARDTMTYPISKKLFQHARTPQEMLDLPLTKLEEIIKPIGFYRRKAQVLKQVSADLIDRFEGKVPATEAELLSITHIGRKTANLVLAAAFDEPAICVDTHVHRLVQPEHLGLIKTKSPDETERELKKMVPKEFWRTINYLLVKWGQHVCKPNTKLCRCWLTLEKYGITKE